MQHNFVPSQHKGGQFIKDKKLSLSWKYISSTLICLKTGLMKLVTRKVNTNHVFCIYEIEARKKANTENIYS